MPRYLTEFLGTFFLVLSIALSIEVAGPNAALAIGSTLMVMVYMGGPISGAHYNPAVTLALHLRGKLPRADILPYMPRPVRRRHPRLPRRPRHHRGQFRPRPRPRRFHSGRPPRRGPLHPRPRPRSPSHRHHQGQPGQLLLRPRHRFHHHRRGTRRRPHLRRRVQPRRRPRPRRHPRDPRRRNRPCLALHRRPAHRRGRGRRPLQAPAPRLRRVRAARGQAPRAAPGRVIHAPLTASARALTLRATLSATAPA